MRKIPFHRLEITMGFKLFLSALTLFAFQHFPMLALMLVTIVMFLPANAKRRIVAAVGGQSEEEKKKEFLDEITKSVQKMLAESQKENANKDVIEKQINDINAKILKLTDEQKAELKAKVDDFAAKNEKLQKDIADANEAIKTQGAELKKLAEKGVKDLNKTRTFKQAVKEAILAKAEKVSNLLTKKTEDGETRQSLKEYFTEHAQKTTPVFVIDGEYEEDGSVNKAAVELLQSNIVGNYVQRLRLTELDPQRVGIPLAVYPHVFDYMKSKTIRRPNMALLVVYSYEDGSATKVEGNASSLSSFLFKTVEFKAFFIATHFILSDETLDDLDEALDEIITVAPDKILSKVDSKILSAAGDDAADIKGIRHADKSTAYATALGAGSLPDANIIDLIADMKLQVKNASYKPNVVILSPANVEKIAAERNTLEDSKQDRRIVFNSLGQPVAICGLALVESTEFTNDQILVMDNTQPTIGRRKDMTMEIGYNGNDMTEGQKTCVFKIRVAFGVRDKAGISYCSGVPAAIAALRGA